MIKQAQSRRGWRRSIGGGLAVLALSLAGSALAAPAAGATETVAATGAVSAQLPYGPYTCKPGFVWREAVPGDQVCVTPQVRDQVRADNAAAPSRREPNGGPYGPATCKQGFVWRESRPSDLACVPPPSRDQARSDNSNGVARLVAPGQTPRGGVWAVTIGGHIYVEGGGLSPSGAAEIYADRVNPAGLRAVGFAYAGADGRIPGRQHVAYVDCVTTAPPVSPVVVVDLRSGIVNTAGTTDAFSCG
jgi:hypothetical protein